jgi:hypothetical protein
MAGSLARPVFVVLGVFADPQWGLEPSGQALWYPETRVRQVMPFDLNRRTRHVGKDPDAWRGVVERLREELEAAFEKKTLAHRGVGISP